MIRSRLTRAHIIELVIFVLVVLFVYKVDSSNFQNAAFYFRKEDIYYEYQAAKDLEKGVNPYERTLDGNMLDNDKYSTLFPLYYYFLKLVRSASSFEFDNFVENFALILFAAQVFGGVFIYALFRSVNKKFLGLVGALIFMLNVWTLESLIFLKQDVIAIALLLGSLFFLRSVLTSKPSSRDYSWLAYVLYGLSLGIKHIGIFVLPLYFAPLFFKTQSRRRFLVNFSLLILTVFVPAIPFVLGAPTALFASMLFSFTRNPNHSEIIFGYNNLLVNYSANAESGSLFDYLLPRLPLVLATLANVYLLISRKISWGFYTLTSILVFAIFNPVIFPQYITWIPPLVFISQASVNDD